MTRQQAIDTITVQLASLDDEAVQDFAEMLEHSRSDSVLPRALTARELALIEQSRQDFRDGRTLSIDELERFLDAGLEQRRKQRTASA